VPPVPPSLPASRHRLPVAFGGSGRTGSLSPPRQRRSVGDQPAGRDVGRRGRAWLALRATDLAHGVGWRGGQSEPERCMLQQEAPSCTCRRGGPCRPFELGLARHGKKSCQASVRRCSVAASMPLRAEEARLASSWSRRLVRSSLILGTAGQAPVFTQRRASNVAQSR
jgi:hypothetical protein